MDEASKDRPPYAKTALTPLASKPGDVTPIPTRAEVITSSLPPRNQKHPPHHP